MKKDLLRPSRFSRIGSFRMTACTDTSRADVGSSRISSFGGTAMARAILSRAFLAAGEVMGKPAPQLGRQVHPFRHRSCCTVLESSGARQLVFAGVTTEVCVQTTMREANDHVPRHRHTGLETILALHGSQMDEQGRHGEGTYVVNHEGTEHSVWTEEGCVVLIQGRRPAAFLGATASDPE